MNTIDNFFEKSADKIIWVFIFIYVFIFTSICFFKYYSFGYHDWDFASDVIVLWNSVHGKFLYYPFLEETIFGTHLYLFVIFLIPIYAVFQHPLTMLFLQTVFLGAAAYPLYLFAKLKLNKTFALVVSLAYLLYPPLGYINLYETHFDSFAVGFLFFALYYFEKEKFSKFLVFLLLAVSCKENISLVVFMFGIYAFFRRKTVQWILSPALLGLIWFFIALRLIIPYFTRDAELYPQGFIFAVFYKHLGNNIFEMVKTILSHPIAALQFAFSPRKILYLYDLFVPTGFIGFLSPAVLLMTIPIFMQNLLSLNWAHTQIFLHYTALLIPFIFCSVVFAFRKLLNFKLLNSYKGWVLSVFLFVSVISAFYLKSPQMYFVKYIKDYQINDSVKEKNRLVKMIPKNASVIATFQFLPMLAERFNLSSMHLVATGFRMFTEKKYQPPQDLEYALIDFKEPYLVGSFFPPEAPANIRSFLDGGNWRVLQASDDTVLFKKGYLGGHRLCELAEEGVKAENPLNANIGNQVIFLGYDLIRENIAENILHFVYYWKYIGGNKSNLCFFIQFLDSENNPILDKRHPLGYRVYLPNSLPEGGVIKEHYYIFIPSNLRKGGYNLRVGFIGSQDNKIIPVLNKEITDKQGRIILGKISVD